MPSLAREQARENAALIDADLGELLPEATLVATRKRGGEVTPIRRD